MKNTFIKCACHTHLLEIQKDEELKITILNFWGYNSDKYPWKVIFKLIWQLLTKRKIVIQEFVLDSDGRRRLIKILKDKYPNYAATNIQTTN